MGEIESGEFKLQSKKSRVKLAEEDLQTRLTQQAILTGLGQEALTADKLESLLEKAARAVTEALKVSHCAILQQLDDPPSVFQLLAQQGFKPRLSSSVFDASREPLAAYALSSKMPVVVKNLESDGLFLPSAVHRQYSLLSAISVLIWGKDRPFGVLEVASHQERVFSPGDVHFVQSVANILGLAVQKEAMIEALGRAEDRFFSLSDATPVLIWMADKDINLTYISKSWMEFTGLPAEQIMGRGWEQVMHPDDINSIVKQYTEAMTQRGTLRVEARIKRWDGQYRWILTDGAPHYSSRCELLGYIGSCVDITERKRWEEDVQESEEIFRTMAECAPVMIWMSDAAGHVTYVNKSWLDFTGLSLEETNRHNWTILIHPDDYEAAANTYMNSIAGNEHSRFRMEYRIRNRSSEYRWLLAVGAPRYLPSGEFRGFVGTAMDVTEMKEAEDKLACYARKLEASNRDLDQFALVASHDLQAPLRKMQMFSEYLLESSENQLPPEAQDYALRIQRSARKMQLLVNDLLDLSRVSRSEKPFTPTPLNNVLRDVVSDLEDSIRASGAQIEIGNLPTINADEAQMAQLFMNLIENAIKFRKPDVLPRIRVYAGETAEGMQPIVVEDNGIGFDAQHSERIFQIFERLHGEQYEGTGIGLAVCRRIAERHGGMIIAESEVGRGSKFTVMIPVQQRR